MSQFWLALESCRKVMFPTRRSPSVPGCRTEIQIVSCYIKALKACAYFIVCVRLNIAPNISMCYQQVKLVIQVVEPVGQVGTRRVLRFSLASCFFLFRCRVPPITPCEVRSARGGSQPVRRGCIINKAVVRFLMQLQYISCYEENFH